MESHLDELYEAYEKLQKARKDRDDEKIVAMNKEIARIQKEISDRASGKIK